MSDYEYGGVGEAKVSPSHPGCNSIALRTFIRGVLSGECPMVYSIGFVHRASSCFEFVHHGHEFDADFWPRLILQVSRSEPTIRHAIIAVSATYGQHETAGSTAIIEDACQDSLAAELNKRLLYSNTTEPSAASSSASKARTNLMKLLCSLVCCSYVSNSIPETLSCICKVGSRY